MMWGITANIQILALHFLNGIIKITPSSHSDLKFPQSYIITQKFVFTKSCKSTRWCSQYSIASFKFSWPRPESSKYFCTDNCGRRKAALLSTLMLMFHLSHKCDWLRKQMTDMGCHLGLTAVYTCLTSSPHRDLRCPLSCWGRSARQTVPCQSSPVAKQWARRPCRSPWRIYHLWRQIRCPWFQRTRQYHRCLWRRPHWVWASRGGPPSQPPDGGSWWPWTTRAFWGPPCCSCKQQTHLWISILA